MALEYGEFAAVSDRQMTDDDYKSCSAYICALLKSGGILPGSNVMSTASKRGWMWAYRKIRDLHCSRLTAIYRATLYAVRGDTGTFPSTLTQRKIHIRR